MKTCKYSILTFLPLNILVQFSKMANFYFLLLCLLELYPPVKTPGGFTSMLTPLIFVIGVSMVKDIFEDRKRYLSDEEENQRAARYVRLGANGISDCKAKEIKVGCFVQVHQDEYFPCDLILVNSSLPKGIAYIETKGLDGETNLKAKQGYSDCVQLATDFPSLVKNFTGVRLECDLPNAELYKF